MDYNKAALEMHKENIGKIKVESKVKLETFDDLSTAYTPGVAEPCVKIHENPEDVYTYTAKSNAVAVISDGSAVLGLGNIGAKAAIPVMEGKCVLFKSFAGIDAYPLCLDTQDTDELVSIIKNLAPSFGGINLEDISAPRCFEIERRVQELVDIPIFHDDQHGTAIVCAAAIKNSLKLVKKNIEDIKIVLSGAGAAGSAIVKILISLGAKNILCCDSKGIIDKKREYKDENKIMLSNCTNTQNESGTLEDAIKGADVFIGVSAPNILSKDMVRTMNSDAILFPMANPTPEIMPQDAFEAGARIVGTGRSDFKNQINNVLAFPGIFRGALDIRAKRITEKMKLAAINAICSIVSDEELSEDYIIPNVFNERVAIEVSKAVADAWEE